MFLSKSMNNENKYLSVSDDTEHSDPSIEKIGGSNIAYYKISQLNFSDIMIWPDGRSFLRHALGYEGPIIQVPQCFQDDIANMISLINEKKRDKEFFFSYDEIPYRVARIDTINGSGYFLRRPKYPLPELDSLGLPIAISKSLLKLGKHSGLILISGATGSGKTTTLYSTLNQLVTLYGDIAVSIEDPPEIPVQNVYGDRGQGLWYQIDAHTAGGFETAMVSAMRYNPRYIMLGEIRTPKVANEAIRAAVNGHLVFATIHGSSILAAILALQQIASAGTGSQELARSILADGLAAVIHQELIPDPEKLGYRKLQADMLCFGRQQGLRSKVRNGKIEHLISDIDAQRLLIQREQLPIDI